MRCCSLQCLVLALCGLLQSPGFGGSVVWVAAVSRGLCVSAACVFITSMQMCLGGEFIFGLIRCSATPSPDMQSRRRQRGPREGCHTVISGRRSIDTPAATTPTMGGTGHLIPRAGVQSAAAAEQGTAPRRQTRRGAVRAAAGLPCPARRAQGPRSSPTHDAAVTASHRQQILLRGDGPGRQSIQHRCSMATDRAGSQYGSPVLVTDRAGSQYGSSTLALGD